jgi:hypothetical protein
MSLLSRINKLRKEEPPPGISFAQALADPALTDAFFAQHGITVDPGAVVPDKIERELERLVAEAERSRLPCGLKQLADESTGQGDHS